MGPNSSDSRPRVLLLSAYDAASHARWRKELACALPEYNWHSLTLPPRYFRWRIRGNPLSWLDEPLLDQDWDAIVATTMVDLATLRGLKPRLAMIPTLAYCHENQFAYPRQGQASRSIEPQMVNLYTLLSAERVAFNSEWNRQSLLAGVAALLTRLPDMKPDNVQQTIIEKSCVIPVPVADELFSEHDRERPEIPHIVWNHRWEHDKAPDRLLMLLRALKQNNFKFSLSVVGEQFRAQPEAFSTIAIEFSDQLQNWGYQSSEADYRKILETADIVLSNALHDFQGLAVLEAMAAGCLPWVPRRLAYPEYVPPQFLYDSIETNAKAEAKKAAKGLASMWTGARSGALQPVVPEEYRRTRLIPRYRCELQLLLDS